MVHSGCVQKQAVSVRSSPEKRATDFLVEPGRGALSELQRVARDLARPESLWRAFLDETEQIMRVSYRTQPDRIFWC